MRPKPARNHFGDIVAVGGLTAAGGLLGGPLGATLGAAAAAALLKERNVIAETQMSEKCREVIDAEKKVFDAGAKVEKTSAIPALDAIPLIDRSKWLKVPSVICVYIDMKDSTKLSVDAKEKDVASAFQLYTGTAVRLLNALDAKYIDVRGDGAFGLFDEGQEYTALVAAVTFKTFANTVAVPSIESRTGVRVGSHVAIDQSSLLVRRVGMRESEDRYDRQNEVWAGRPVNMAAKLASLTADDELLVSKRYFDELKDEKSTTSCGCGADGKKTSLWSKVDVSADGRFDFDTAYKLSSSWCSKHGKEFMEALLDLDKEKAKEKDK